MSCQDFFVLNIDEIAQLFVQVYTNQCMIDVLQFLISIDAIVLQ